LKKAERLIAGDRLVVVNLDTFVDVRLRELVKFHMSQKAQATLTAVKVPDSGRYGLVRLDRSRRITAFLEKRGRVGYRRHETQEGLINGGVYVLEKKVLKTIGRGRNASLEREVFPALLAEKCMYGFKTDGYFLDIGMPEELRRAQSELPKRIRVSHSR
jgi:NDP-sugar pyrophosphorylase family protein